MELFRTAFLVLLALGATGYAVASVALWTGALRRSRRIPRGGDLPTVTVIVPARNEAANIASCLTALSRQSYPPHLCKIVVVDDRSDDGTGEIAARAACAMEAVVQVVRVDTVPPGWSPKKHALHRAILESTSDIILTTDADCEPEECWIEEMVASLSAAHVVAGYSPYRDRTSLPARLLALETLSQAFLAMGGIGIGRPITCTGRSLGYRREVYAAVGGFGEAHSMLSGDDHLFLQRAVGAGFTAAFCDGPGSYVWTNPPPTWRGFVQQRIRMFSGARMLKPAVAALGVFVYAWLAVMGVGMLAAFPAAWGAFGVKVLLDGVSMGIAAVRLHEKRLLAVYPIAAFLYLPYFLVFALWGTVGSYGWKGARGH